MKTLDKAFIIAGVVSLSSLACVSSCDSNSEVSSSQPKPTRQIVDSKLKQNKWGVVYFFDDRDETHLYSGYTFEFDENGSVIATNINSSAMGVWSTYPSSKEFVKLNLEFTLKQPFDELNEDWVVTEMTDEAIILEHAGSQPGETDIIKLEKINS